MMRKTTKLNLRIRKVMSMKMDCQMYAEYVKRYSRVLLLPYVDITSVKGVLCNITLLVLIALSVVKLLMAYLMKRQSYNRK